ncbi:MAG: hypothetical protein ACPG32_13550, partial [Akkermansiaceae bacterium]
MKPKKINRAAGLSAMCAAAGVASALTQATQAASLATDLVVNGSFESVTAVTGSYGSLEVDGGWLESDGSSVFAYNYAQNYDDRDGLNTVPPGNNAAASDDFFFTLNGGDAPGIQLIDLSTGDTATAIMAGNAMFDVRGFFTNYATDEEGGMLSVIFYDNHPQLGGLQVGSTVSYTDSNLDEWTQIGGTGAIPSAALFVEIIIDQDPATNTTGGGADVYADNITFEVNAVPEPSSGLLALGGAS